MISRKKLRHVAAGLLASFISRNNDLAGYWAPGLLYRECGADLCVRLNLLAPGAAPSPRIATAAARQYAEFLRRALIRHGLQLEQLAHAEIELRFDADIALNDVGRGWIGEPFVCTVTLTAQDGRAARAQGIRRCARYEPGRFTGRAHSGGPAFEPLLNEATGRNDD